MMYKYFFFFYITFLCIMIIGGNVFKSLKNHNEKHLFSPKQASFTY